MEQQREIEKEDQKQAKEKQQQEEQRQEEQEQEQEEVTSRRLAWPSQGVQPKSKEGKPRSANSPALQGLFRGITGLGRRDWTAYLLSRVL